MADKFFNFPVPLLSMPEDYQTVLEKIVSYCCVTAGRTEGGARTADDINFKARPVADTPKDFDIGNRDHNSAMLGSFMLNVSIGSAVACVKRFRDANAFAEKAESYFGPSPRVFIGTPLVWEIKEGKTSMSWREFRLLCAVNSVMGLTRTGPVRITREMIQARALGYKRHQDLETARKARLPVGELLTVSELRTGLDHLEFKHGFFIRVSPTARRTYFFKGVTRDEAREATRSMLLRSQAAAIERAKDRALMKGAA